jgi:uncharacterized SAM-binding protein YcdF (DUF218 family)
MRFSDGLMGFLRWLGVAVTMATIVSAFTPLWNAAGRRLAVKPVLQPADAIVVLGGGVRRGELGDESLRRTIHGIELYKRGLAPIIVFSGPQPLDDSSLAEAEVRKRLALRMGVPSDRIITITKIRTTHDESRQTALELGRFHATTILLVTEALHMRRAMAAFELAGFRTFPAPSDDEPRLAASPAARLELMWRVVVQAAGLFYYRMAGYG